MPRCDHAGVGETGLRRRLILAVDDFNLVPIAGKEVGGGNAGKPRAEDEDPH